MNSIRSIQRRWLAVLTSVLTISALAQTPLSPPPGGAPPRGGPGGPGGRGGPPNLSPEERIAVNNFNTNLTAEALAVTIASSNLVAATYSTPKDEAKIIAANNALAKAREAWAMKASAQFAKVQASPDKLSESAIQMLINSAPGGGRGGRGGFPGGPGGPGGRGGPRGGPPGQQ